MGNYYGKVEVSYIPEDSKSMYRGRFRIESNIIKRYDNANIILSGNFLIVNENTDGEITSHIFNLETIKAYKVHVNNTIKEVI